MNALLISATVFLTIILAVAFGIACGYVAVLGMFQLMSRDRRKVQAAAAASLTHATQGGD